MKIQYCSDLHLEFDENIAFLKQNPLVPSGEILVIAGDFYLLGAKREFISDILTYLSKNWKAVFWLPGNHEYYHYSASNAHLEQLEEITENVFWVNNKSVEMNDIRFVFTTLWSHIRPENVSYCESGVSDFKAISYNLKRLRSNEFNFLNRESLKFIRQELRVSKAYNKIVVTHHVPTYINYPSIYLGSRINDAFVSDNVELIEEYQPDFWIYGHSHVNTPEFNIGKTRLVTNQLGYVKEYENKLFRKDAVIEI